MEWEITWIFFPSKRSGNTDVVDVTNRLFAGCNCFASNIEAM